MVLSILLSLLLLRSVAEVTASVLLGRQGPSSDGTAALVLDKRQQTTIFITLSTIYFTGDVSRPRTAQSGYDIRVDVSNSAWGFCGSDNPTQCDMAGACVDSFTCSNCCGFGNTALKTWTCDNPNARYCSTALLTLSSDSPRAVTYLACADKPNRTEDYKAFITAATPSTSSSTAATPLPSPQATSQTTSTTSISPSQTTSMSTSSPSQTTFMGTSPSQTATQTVPNTTSATGTGMATPSATPPTTSSSSSTTPANDNNNSSTTTTTTNTAMIVGASVGCAALICTCVVAVFLIRRGRAGASSSAAAATTVEGTTGGGGGRGMGGEAVQGWEHKPPVVSELDGVGHVVYELGPGPGGVAGGGEGGGGWRR